MFWKNFMMCVNKIYPIERTGMGFQNSIELTWKFKKPSVPDERFFRTLILGQIAFLTSFQIDIKINII